jgi:hypothetical protein
MQPSPGGGGESAGFSLDADTVADRELDRLKPQRLDEEQDSLQHGTFPGHNNVFIRPAALAPRRFTTSVSSFNLRRRAPSRFEGALHPTPQR